MSIRYRFISLFFTLIAVFSIAAAQDGYPLPESLPVITAENASQLTELAHIGGALPAGLAWSPDGQTLAVGLTDKVLLYDVNDLTQPRLTLPANGVRGFYITGELLSIDGEIWDTQTGQIIPSVIEETMFSPSGKFEVIRRQINGQEKITLVKPSGEIAPLPFPNNFALYLPMFSPDESRLMVVADLDNIYGNQVFWVDLWDVENGEFIRNISRNIGSSVFDIRFSQDGRQIFISYIDTTIVSQPQRKTVVISSETGHEMPTPLTVSINPSVATDGNLFAFRNASGEVVLWDNHELGIIPHDLPLSTRMKLENSILLIWHNKHLEVWDWDINTAIIPTSPRLTVESAEEIDSLKLINGQALIFDTAGGIEVLDTQTGQFQPSFQLPAGETINLISPDGQLISTWVSEGSQNIYHIPTGAHVITIPSGGSLNMDWSKAAAWQDDCSIWVADVLTGEINTVQIIESERCPVSP